MNYYNEIKKELINNEVTKKIKDFSKNKSDLNTYFNVGKILSEAGKHYGEGIIKEYSTKLKTDIGKQYTERTLRRFRQFYQFCVTTNWSTLSTNLSWSHYSELLILDDIDKITYYISICEMQSLTIRELRNKIKNKKYERLPEETKCDFKLTKNTNIKFLIKNPIIIKNKYSHEIISENLLQKLILENIPAFLEELGIGFTFIKNEYKIKLGDKYNYIDFLHYNIKYKCYVVIELKITPLKKEHIGQIETYMNYIDRNLKTINENKTIEIIIVKKNNKYIMEYCSDKRILTKEYKLI